MKEIAEYILQKLGNIVYDEEAFIASVITTDGEVYELCRYESLIHEGLDSPAYIYVENKPIYDDPGWSHLVYNYPFMDSDLLADIYLRKYYRNHFGKLKYIAIITYFLSPNQTAMEVVDVDVVENNINLKELLRVLNKKEDDDDDDEEERINEFYERLESQRLFNGHSFKGAIEIIKKYYRENDKSLADDVKAIKDDYYRIFQPYRIELSPNQRKG